MTDSTPKRRPPLTVAAALRRVAEDAVRRDPSAKKSPTRDDETGGKPDDTSTP